MNHLTDFFNLLYQNFNDRKIDLVVTEMTNDVKWANGMDGGYVYGHYGIREYWKKQFALVSSNVTPIEITTWDELIKIKVHQVVHDLKGNLLADEIVYHVFHLKENKIAEFDIANA